MISLQIFRRILWIIHIQAVEYIPGEGAVCPASKFVKHQGGRVQVSSSRGEVRFHKCPECGLSFKSVEKRQPEDEITEIVTVPRKVDGKTKRRHYKKKRTVKTVLK